jgi:long-chain acyl-CoA synthetase
MAEAGADTKRSFSALDTFPKLLERNAREHPDRSAIREKEFGIWQTWTWRDLEAEVREFACGLADLGFERGDRLAIIGDNRPRLYAAMCAVQSIGGIPVPMYQDSVAKELGYVMQHAEARFAIAEDQEQVDKLLELRGSCPSLEKIVYVDPRGMRHYDLSSLVSYEEVQKRGCELNRRDEAFWDAEVAKGAGSDPGIILYTSGTTGNPKGVVLLFDNVVKMAYRGAEFEGLGPGDEVLAYLPMAWVGDHIFSFAQSYVVGFCMSCPESGATVLDDLREIGPTYFFAPPRIFENLLTTVMIRMEDASRLKRKMFHERELAARGKTVGEASFEEMDELWEQAKALGESGEGT